MTRIARSFFVSATRQAKNAIAQIKRKVSCLANFGFQQPVPRLVAKKETRRLIEGKRAEFEIVHRLGRWVRLCGRCLNDARPRPPHV
jgi:hypothetical protein